MSEKIKVSKFTVISRINMDTIIVETYGDGTFIREDLYTLTMGVDFAKNNALFNACVST